MDPTVLAAIVALVGTVLATLGTVWFQKRKQERNGSSHQAEIVMASIDPTSMKEMTDVLHKLSSVVRDAGTQISHHSISIKEHSAPISHLNTHVEKLHDEVKELRNEIRRLGDNIK